MIFVHASIIEGNGARETCQVYNYVNKNAPRFREALCVLRVPIIRLLLSMHKCLTVGTGGSCGHGHVEVSRVHVRQYSMREWERGQGAENFKR
jgi:hypothetical protein